MTDTVTLPSERAANNAATRVGQATAVEQSRAVAEVKAAVVVAQQCPRDVQNAVDAMRESCGQYTLAQRAFFRYNRGGSAIQGPSVHLARELARVWGNIQYGISELRRDDTEGVSEMQAYAWDIQTNTRMASIFIVPHMRDTKGGAKKLTDLRDVYENNANQGARRVREAIFAVLPPWFIEEAKDLCTQTLASGGGKPLAQRVADAVKWFEGAGVRLAQLEEKVGRQRAQWEGVDIARLEVIARSLTNGEISLEDEFTPPRVSADEITKANTKTAAASEPEPDPPPDTSAAEAASPAPDAEGLIDPKGDQMKALHASLNDAGMPDRIAGLAFISDVVDRDVKSTKDITVSEASRVLDELRALVEHPFPGPAPQESS